MYNYAYDKKNLYYWSRLTHRTMNHTSTKCELSLFFIALHSGQFLSQSFSEKLNCSPWRFDSRMQNYLMRLHIFSPQIMNSVRLVKISACH